MAHIPVGKKLPVTEYVPLPEPRPSYVPEEPFSGNWDIGNLIYHPWVEMKEEGKVGLELMTEQWNYLTTALRDVSIYDIVPVVSYISLGALLIGGILSVSYFIFLGISYILSKFRK